MEVALFIAPTVGPKEELMKGLAGRRTDLYQTMVKHLIEIAQYTDEMGYYGIGFTEHHLSVEGMTCSISPQMLGLHLSHYTKHLRFGALGHVLPVHDPLRVAAAHFIAHAVRERIDQRQASDRVAGSVVII